MSENTTSIRGAAKRLFQEYSHRTIAIVYDFDGTLTPQTMHEYTVFPELQIDSSRFWAEVKLETQKHEATEVLTYMRMLAEKIHSANLPINKQRLGDLGAKVPYFPGVETWFERVDAFIQKETLGYVKVKHYIVSAGLREILQGISIANKFAKIFASQYHYDAYGRPSFVDRVITDVSKTQYLFRINKGVEDLSLTVNEHMPDHSRPIPFHNIIYIGDGDTDVPSMAVTRKNGGHSFAVFSPGESDAKCRVLLDAGRVDAYFEADYSPNKPLEHFTMALLKKMVSDIRYRSMLHVFRKGIHEGEYR